MAKERYLLFAGHLDDAPGRAESWKEYLRYVGSGSWQLLVSGTDFSGRGSAESLVEHFSTKALVEWVLERDAEDDAVVEDEDSDSPRRLGRRSARLLRIAREAGALLCVRRLEAWQAGTWPKPKPAPRILRVDGVERRPVWIRIYRVGYVVQTTAGVGFIYPPAQDRTTTLVIRQPVGGEQTWRIRCPRRLMLEIGAFRPKLEDLERS
jgi:hypothetical protein